jgi:transposase InsO family protein
VSLNRSSKLLGISRQAIYQSEKRQQKRQAELAPVTGMVMTLRRFMPRLGTRKLYKLLKPQLIDAGIKLGRDGLFAYLRDQQMLVKPRKSYTKTTNSKHWMKKHPNLLKDLEIKQPEQVLVSDITYVESDEGVHYLSLVTDASSRKIMGHELSRDMKAENVVNALHRAAQSCNQTKSVIHHSDRGSQYCSSLYQDALNQNGMVPSMTDGYDCYQNALAERINGILKQEFLLYRCKTFTELKALVDESITIYNRMRPHLSLGMKTPEEVHRKAAA